MLFSNITCSLLQNSAEWGPRYPSPASILFFIGCSFVYFSANPHFHITKKEYHKKHLFSITFPTFFHENLACRKVHISASLFFIWSEFWETVADMTDTAAVREGAPPFSIGRKRVAKRADRLCCKNLSALWLWTIGSGWQSRSEERLQSERLRIIGGTFADCAVIRTRQLLINFV